MKYVVKHLVKWLNKKCCIIKKGGHSKSAVPHFLLSKSYSGNRVVVQKIFQFFAFTGIIVI